MKKLLLSVVFALVMPAASTRAGTLAPSKPSQLVTLTNINATCSSGVKLNTQVNGDGSRSTFAGIPDGRVLVITGAGAVANSNGTTPFVFLIDTDGGASSLWFGAGVDGATVPVPNVVVKSGQTLCVRVFGLGVTFQAYVHGFFANDK